MVKYKSKFLFPGAFFVLVGLIGLVAESFFVGRMAGITSEARQKFPVNIHGFVEKVSPCLNGFLCFKITESQGSVPVPVNPVNSTPGGTGTPSASASTSSLSNQKTKVRMFALKNTATQIGASNGTASQVGSSPGGGWVTPGVPQQIPGGPPDQLPTPDPNTCLPRPPCLDATPACKLAEPAGGWCPGGTPVPPPNITGPVSCAPRPPCLDTNPSCLIGPPEGMQFCPPVPPPVITGPVPCAPRPACLDNPLSGCNPKEPPQGWCPPGSPPPNITPAPKPKGKTYFLVSLSRPRGLFSVMCMSANGVLCGGTSNIIDLSLYVGKYVELNGTLISSSSPPYVLVQSIREIGPWQKITPVPVQQPVSCTSDTECTSLNCQKGTRAVCAPNNSCICEVNPPPPASAACCGPQQLKSGFHCVERCGPPVSSLDGTTTVPVYDCLSPQAVQNRMKFGCPI